MDCVRRVLTGSCILLVVGGAGSRAQSYKALGQYRLPGTGATGLAVDTPGRRILVATTEGVVVLNADTGADLGRIAGLSSAHDVLLVPEMNGEEAAPSTKGVATDASGGVYSFSLTDMKVTGKAHLVTSGAASLCYDEEAKTVDAVSSGGSLLSMDAETSKVVHGGRITTGAGQIACGTLHHVYVADPMANVVHVLNDETLKNDGDFPMMTGHGPSGLALDPKGRRLFVGCEDGTIEIIDTDAGFTFTELKGGTGPAHALFAWLPQGNTGWKAAAFIAQQDGTLSGVRMNAYINYSAGGTYKFASGLGAIGYDAKTHHLFIAGTNAGAPVLSVVGY